MLLYVKLVAKLRLQTRHVQVLEHSWAMIFGEPAVLQPIPECQLIDCQREGGQVRVWGYGREGSS